MVSSDVGIHLNLCVSFEQPADSRKEVDTRTNDNLVAGSL